MDGILAALEATGAASFLRGSRWGYAAVNTVHVLGIALLVGAILPLDLRLLGVGRDVPRRPLVHFLAPAAATGLALAVLSGLLLFSVRAHEYAAVGVLQVKLALVVTGASAALLLHLAHGRTLDDASEAKLRSHALLSATCWLGALVCGRLIAFAAN